MLKKLVLAGTALCLTSCATIISKKEYNLRVLSHEDNMKAVINDSIYTLPAKVKVKRSKEDLKITLIGDTLRRDFTVKSSPSPEFVYGNLVFMQACPIGYAVDFTTQKRFYYGRKVNLDRNAPDSIIEPRILRRWNNYFSKKYTTPKGTWAFTASIPYANGFYQQPKNEPAKDQYGFFGTSIGMEYYYKDDRFVKVTTGAYIDFEVPVPVPLDRFDSYETMSAYNLLLTDNHKFNRFSFGYGLNYTIHSWRMVNHDWEFPSNDEEPRAKDSHSFGLTANAYYQVINGLSVGLVYSPTFYNVFPKGGASYQHVISFDVMYRLPFKF